MSAPGTTPLPFVVQEQIDQMAYAMCVADNRNPKTQSEPDSTYLWQEYRPEARRLYYALSTLDIATTLSKKLLPEMD